MLTRTLRYHEVPMMDASMQLALSIGVPTLAVLVGISSLIVVDCRIIGGFACQAALLSLRSEGFTKVAGMALPRMGRSLLCGS